MMMIMCKWREIFLLTKVTFFPTPTSFVEHLLKRKKLNVSEERKESLRPSTWRNQDRLSERKTHERKLGTCRNIRVLLRRRKKLDKWMSEALSVTRCVPYLLCHNNEIKILRKVFRPVNWARFTFDKCTSKCDNTHGSSDVCRLDILWPLCGRIYFNWANFGITFHSIFTCIGLHYCQRHFRT